jgi:hypothetical protein
VEEKLSGRSLGPDGTSSVRVITDDVCPIVTFDGKAFAMDSRAEPSQNFGGVKQTQSEWKRACETPVPRGSVAAVVDGNPLPLPKANPRRIVIVGDSGCRLDKYEAQACNQAASWPFPKIAEFAAAIHPDLVIHVGDYVYRETRCPTDNLGCAGSPWGRGWDAWYADFSSRQRHFWLLRPGLWCAAITKIAVAPAKGGFGFSIARRLNRHVATSPAFLWQPSANSELS